MGMTYTRSVLILFRRNTHSRTILDKSFNFHRTMFYITTYTQYEKKINCKLRTSNPESIFSLFRAN